MLLRERSERGGERVSERARAGSRESEGRKEGGKERTFYEAEGVCAGRTAGEDGVESVGVLDWDDLARHSFFEVSAEGKGNGKGKGETHLISCTMHGEDVNILWEGMLEVIVVPFCERAELSPRFSSARLGALPLPLSTQNSPPPQSPD